MGGVETGVAISEWHGRGGVDVWGYANSSHVGDVDTTRGSTGYVFLSGRATIRWRSGMMKHVTHSSCESEYVGLSEVGNEVVHLYQLQGELGIGGGGVRLLGTMSHRSSWQRTRYFINGLNISG